MRFDEAGYIVEFNEASLAEIESNRTYFTPRSALYRLPLGASASMILNVLHAPPTPNQATEGATSFTFVDTQPPESKRSCTRHPWVLLIAAFTVIGCIIAGSVWLELTYLCKLKQG